MKLSDENGNGLASRGDTNKVDFVRLFAIRLGLGIRESANRALATGDDIVEVAKGLTGSTIGRRRARLFAIDAGISVAIGAAYNLIETWEDARNLIRENIETLTLQINEKQSP